MRQGQATGCLASSSAPNCAYRIVRQHLGKKMQREKQSLSVCLFSCMSVIEMSISNYINNTAMSEFAALHAVCKHQVVSKSSSFEVLTNYQNYTHQNVKGCCWEKSDTKFTQSLTRFCYFKD